MKNLPPRRPHHGRRGGVFLWATLPLVLASGCSLTPPAPLYPVSTPQPAAVKRARELAQYRSVNEAFSKLDAKTIGAWVDRWTRPGGKSGQGRPVAIRIDADALARRHPAWQLASALENGSVSPDSPRVAQAIAVSSSTLPALMAPGAAFPVQNLPARSVSDGFSGEAARNRQSTALERFFASAEARDTLRGRDEAYLARRDLEDAIAAAQRGAVADLDLQLIPADVALELTNLRLQLLRTLARTPAQRAASREQIQAIQARFADLWRQQTELQAARMREATIDLPARLRREGEARIKRDGDAETKKRGVARGDIEAQSKQSLNADFARDAADLRLVLPATRWIGKVVSRGSSAGTQFFETTPPGLPSIGARNRSALSTRGQADSKIVSALRAKARKDSRQWAQLVAARLGSRWENKPANPDRTAAALAILFPTSSR